MFAYDVSLLERYPAIRAAAIHVSGLINGPGSPELLGQYHAEQHAAAERLTTTAVADLPSIAAWRRAFSLFGAKPTQHRNAAEALLRRLAKRGDIPAVNVLVDIGNLVSIRHALPVAVFDLATIEGELTVRVATGAESFTDLGSSGSVHPSSGEVIFVDDADVVAARRWCCRQSAHSATGPGTVQALIVIEGLHDTAEQDVSAALRDLTTLLAEHQPGSQIKAHLLSPAAPRVVERGGRR